MSDAKIAGKARAVTAPDFQPEVLTLDAFCAQHALSRTTFFRLRKAGQAPRLMKVGRRIFVTPEAAREWRDRMQGLDVKAAA